ncbi:uncharacterized protein [Rhodnius prolixus]|uniref:uncharacterized protein n=1 Tax=Rhodnius prolixus TaxID=13249 RepID=UPI003D187753
MFTSQSHEQNSWRHVRSQYNPADLISRSISPKDILTCDMWWKGPSWLSQSETHWPDSILTTEIEPEIEERRKLVNAKLATNDPFTLAERYSSWNKLLRITALCQRFISNCKNPQTKQIGHLQANDLEKAELSWIRYIQALSFESDIKKLKNKLEVSNLLKSLCPFIDSDGLLRVGGRLKHANLDPDHKYPLLLPEDHYITRLILKRIHIKTLHGGPQLLLATARTKYWPLNGRNLVRSVVRNCLACRKVAPKPLQHIMGDLPSYRVQPAHPFLHCGIDYCGPIYFRRVLQRRSSPAKAYVAIFICMVTKAIHIELVIDLTTKKLLKRVTEGDSTPWKNPLYILGQCYQFCWS